MDTLDPRMIPVYRAMRPADRVVAGLAATEMVRERLRAHLAHLNPEWDAKEVEAAVAGRLLGTHDCR